MAVTPEARSWSDLFAARTRADVGGELAAILALVASPDLISFAGGFPDPQTFPGSIAADLLAELVASGDPTPFQYSPSRGLAGPLGAFAVPNLRLQRPLHAVTKIKLHRCAGF